MLLLADVSVILGLGCGRSTNHCSLNNFNHGFFNYTVLLIVQQRDDSLGPERLFLCSILYPKFRVLHCILPQWDRQLDYDTNQTKWDLLQTDNNTKLVVTPLLLMLLVIITGVHPQHDCHSWFPTMSTLSFYQWILLIVPFFFLATERLFQRPVGFKLSSLVVD